MQIEVKDKYTGKNIKEPNSEIPDKASDKKSNKKVTKRRRKAPLKIIIPIAAIVGIVAGLSIAVLIFSFRSKLIGTWTQENDIWVYEFKEDGTGTYGIGIGTPISFHYKDNGSSVAITRDKSGTITELEYRIEDNKLIVKTQFNTEKTYIKEESD